MHGVFADTTWYLQKNMGSILCVMEAFMTENTNILNIIDADDLHETIDIEVTKEKPFNKCLNCEYLGNGCSGPNLNAMSVERACEFLQIRRVQLGYSYQKTADLSFLSLVTVKRILTGKIKDPSFLSMQALTFALVADPKGKYPCAMEHFTEETEQAVAACKVAQAALAQKEKELAEEKEKVAYRDERIRSYQHQVEFKEAQMLAKDQQLKERTQFMKTKDRAITLLSLFLSLAVAAIIFALIVDVVNPDMGFFWTAFHRNSTNSFFNNWGL